MITRVVLLASVAMGTVNWRGVHAKEGSVRANVDANAATDNVSGHDMTEVLRSLIKNKPSAPIGGGERELSAPIVLTFEGVGDLAQVGNYYNGGAGPNYGVAFGSSALGLVDSDAGGSGATANEPSPETVLFFPDTTDTSMTYAAGFTGLSFYVASLYDTAITVYDGPAGTGNVLATVSIPATGICDYQFPSCGDPNGEFGVWVPFVVPFTGVAKSVIFSGPGISGSAGFDDITVTTTATPPCTKTTYWLWNPTTDKLVGELTNNTSTCISVPYNIEVRPCTAPKSLPIYITLQTSALALIQKQAEFAAPFYLWGDTTATGDVYPNKKPLPKGTYYLNSNIDGKVETIKFTKTC